MPCSFEFFVLFTITPQYNRREGDAKIHYEMIVMFLFLFCKETMELRIIHTFFCPCPFVSLIPSWQDDELFQQGWDLLLFASYEM